jgi:hypothetical protein
MPDLKDIKGQETAKRALESPPLADTTSSCYWQVTPGARRDRCFSEVRLGFHGLPTAVGIR